LPAPSEVIGAARRTPSKLGYSKSAGCCSDFPSFAISQFRISLSEEEVFMKTTGNTVLITGGATGIGFATAEVLLKPGNEVIICGRREERLREAKEKLAGVHIKTCNVANAEDRKALFSWTTTQFPEVNILINNAGIQRHIDLRKGMKDLSDGEDEIETNLRALIHLSALFVPHFAKQKEAAIVNVSSGLGFVPIAVMPVYCATKAAVHSFTLSLRHQLREAKIKVFEIVPPTVDTELDHGTRAGRGQANRGIPPKEVAGATLSALAKDEFEAAVGQAQFLRQGSRTDPEQTFQRINGG
jgi:uncharacterized oxidoreductase